MQKIHLLFFNQYISNSKVRKVISEKYNLFIFNVAEQFRKQMMEEENEVVIRIKSFMDNGLLVPNDLLEEFLKINLNGQNQDILLIGFPRAIEQLSMLKNLNLEIQTIWYVKQQDGETYMNEHFKKPNEKQWVEKFGEEVIKKWKQDFEQNQIFVAEIQKVTDRKIWKIIEVDYETETNEELVSKKINDCP